PVKQKLESFFINLQLTYEEVGENMWMISDDENNLGYVVVYAEEELVTLRAKVMQVPSENREKYFEELLRLNAEMVHGAYAIEEDSVILIDSLEAPTMDLEEFQASLDSTGLALAQHYPRLAKYRDKK
ncbi:MAG: YbjN domain-containing protein, partial [Spirochaetia bacterium]